LHAEWNVPMLPGAGGASLILQGRAVMSISGPCQETGADVVKPIVPHDTWDAGELACGPMLLALKGRLERLEAGQVFRLTTRDEGAPVDVPAWCRLTGHRLLRAAHPYYHLERRKD